MRTLGIVAVALAASSVAVAQEAEPGAGAPADIKLPADEPAKPEPAPPPKTKLDEKNGFRDMKLGTELDKLEGLSMSGKGDGFLFYTRKDDTTKLFGTPLAGIAYGFADGKLSRIVVASAWTLHAKTAKCEADTAYVAKQLVTAFGKVNAVHGYSTPVGKQCIRDYSGAVESPYCRVKEWKGRNVTLKFYEIATASPRKAPEGVAAEDGWTGYSCRYVLQYDRVADPLEDL